MIQELVRLRLYMSLSNGSGVYSEQENKMRDLSLGY
jgi:hypothetical protein